MAALRKGVGVGWYKQGVEAFAGQLMLDGRPSPSDGRRRPVLDGLADVTPDAGAVARFTARVVPTPGCHYFIGAYDSGGYGVLAYPDKGGVRVVAAHRFAAWLAGLRLAPGEVVQHQCNERICCRIGPGHIVTGSQADNVRYAVACGRHRGPLPGVGDPRGPVGRARAIRAALAPSLADGGLWPGYHPATLLFALHPDTGQLALFNPEPRGAPATSDDDSQLKQAAEA